MSETFHITIPDFCVVAFVGISGSGKSTFAARHFLISEILSSDAFRRMVSDDENDQSATKDAFEALYAVADLRLRRRKLVVIDATNVQPEARKPLLSLAHRHDCFAVAIVLDVQERVCRSRNRERADRQFGPHVVANQARQLRQAIRGLKREGFRTVFTLDESRIETAELHREPLWTDRRSELGPFDLIGDIHGCCDELLELLGKLGYAPDEAAGAWRHPEGRRAVFLGDLVDRGPKVVEVVSLVRSMAAAGSALSVPGNHDTKLVRALRGNPVSVAHGLQASLDQIEAIPEEDRAAFKSEYCEFIEGLVSHLWLDGGKLCAAHAGMKEAYIGRASGRVREFALYGETTGESDASGLPIRYPWAQDYRGATTVVYGHTPVTETEWLNNTINIDTGCVFGGKLTALRWPEREIVQVTARAAYQSRVPVGAVDPAANGSRSTPVAGDPHHPGEPGEEQDDGSSPGPASETRSDARASEIGEGVSAQWEHDSLLHAEDVLGKRLVATRAQGSVMIPPENAAAALEVMSRFAVEPRWLIYLPPTMSPCETAKTGDVLEHPLQAFEYYRGQNVDHVVCQRKHMGSRAVLVACRDHETARRRFGATEDTLGELFTRTGRRFFDDASIQSGLIRGAVSAITAANLWEELNTDWISLDCELMPWNAKAQSLVREQYAPVGAAARLARSEAAAAAEAALANGADVKDLLDRLRTTEADIQKYTAAYSRYCAPVDGIEGIHLAPFHLLATEGTTYFHVTHDYHLSILSRLATASDLFIATESLAVDLTNEQSIAEGIAWWESLTEAGGEGMVVKPNLFETRGPRGLVQPAMKVRGREYLRIIYGPEYTQPANIERLRARRLGTKRRLALREFALGVEALERFVRKEPLRRVHECVFGVLALESEPVDPRL